MSLMSLEKLQAIIEAALMIANRPLSIAALQQLFNEDERPNSKDLRNILDQLSVRLAHEESGIYLQEVASGFRIQAKAELSPWLSKLFEERAPRYSRAFLETLAIIAYKQPITRAEIEEIRGVTVSTNIMKTLQEREWIRMLGHRDLPGKPAIYGTTKVFLDYFNLKSLTELPSLAEFKALADQEALLNVQLALEESNIQINNSDLIPEERAATLEDSHQEVDSIELEEAEQTIG